MEKQDIVVTERTVVIEVLEKYRKLQYLWNPTHKLYTNKFARKRGLEIMLRSWRKLEPKANIDSIRRKLNNWRAAYRRERRKVEDSMETASDPDDYHKPALWYYNYLTFIHDDCPVLSKDDDGDNECDLGGDDDGNDMVGADNDEGCNEEGGSDNDEDDEEEPEKKPRMTSYNRKSNERSTKQEQTVDSAQVLMHPNEETSSADWFGRAIGSQLKEVSKFQRCLAEKLISEIMFYAKLEQLTLRTSINLESTDS